MAKEIERKFLVLNEDFKQAAIRVHHIEQGYLKQNQPTVRIRIKDDEAFITIKGKSTADGLTRDEWEYPIPRHEAQEMMNLCSPPLYERSVTSFRTQGIFGKLMFFTINSKV